MAKKKSSFSNFYCNYSFFFTICFIYISDGQYTQFAISGSLVMALVGYGLALGQDITYYKTEYKIQDMFVASPISPLTYMTGLALSEILFGFPALVVLLFLIFYIGVSLLYIPLLIFIILIVWISTSSMGFFFIFTYVTYEKCNPDYIFR